MIFDIFFTILKVFGVILVIFIARAVYLHKKT